MFNLKPKVKDNEKIDKVSISDINNQLDEIKDTVYTECKELVLDAIKHTIVETVGEESKYQSMHMFNFSSKLMNIITSAIREEVNKKIEDAKIQLDGLKRQLKMLRSL